MKTINARIGQFSLESIATELLRNSNNHQHKKKTASYKPQFARFKLKCYFTDGNTKVFYSYDTHHKFTNGVKSVVNNENEGVTKLFTYVMSVQSNIKTAIIWVTFEKEKGTTDARYNNEIYKGVNRNGKFFHTHPVRLDFDENGFLRTVDLKRYFTLKESEEKNERQY
jgi:hypothetical protein